MTRRTGLSILRAWPYALVLLSVWAFVSGVIVDSTPGYMLTFILGTGAVIALDWLYEKEESHE